MGRRHPVDRAVQEGRCLTVRQARRWCRACLTRPYLIWNIIAFEIQTQTEVVTSASVARTQRIEGRFLKGPIPTVAIVVASRLPGTALAVYLAIRHQADLSRNAEVVFPASLAAELKLNRDAKARALPHLEQAGLINVAREKGRSAKIKLV